MKRVTIDTKDITDVLSMEVLIASESRTGRKLVYNSLTNMFVFSRNGDIVKIMDRNTEGFVGAVDFWNNEF